MFSIDYLQTGQNPTAWIWYMLLAVVVLLLIFWWVTAGTMCHWTSRRRPPFQRKNKGPMIFKRSKVLVQKSPEF